MKTQLSFSVETGEPESGWTNSRWASIRLDDVTIFSELVYDAEPDGSRSAEQARKNVIHLFAYRVRQLLEDS